MKTTAHAARALVLAGALLVSMAPAQAQMPGTLIGGQGPIDMDRAEPTRLPLRFRKPRHESRPAPEKAASELAGSDEQADSRADAPIMVYRAGRLTVECRGVPASEFFLELGRRTGLPVRLDGALDRNITASFVALPLTDAIARLLPKAGYSFGRDERGTITGLWIHGTPAGTDGPVRVDSGAINLIPAGMPAPARAPGGGAPPIRVLTDEEARADDEAGSPDDEDQAAAPAPRTADPAKGATASSDTRPPSTVEMTPAQREQRYRELLKRIRR